MAENLNEQQRLRSRTRAAEAGTGTDQDEQRQGISPVNPSSMPRAEDDEQTFARSPEYHDRVPPGAARERETVSRTEEESTNDEPEYGPDGTIKPPEPAS